MPRADVTPPRDELVAGGPRRDASPTGPPPGGRRPDGDFWGGRPGGRGRKRSRGKSATRVLAVIAASGLAIGIGVAIDQLVLPARSEKTAASGPGSDPSTLDLPGPQSDTPTTAGPGSGTPTGGAPGAAGGSPAPTAAEQTPPLKPIHPRKTASAEPSKSKKASEPASPPSTGGGGTPSGSGGSSASEAAVVSLTNAERSKAGCQPLRIDQRLVVAARKHSADMAANDYFDHTSRNGDSPWKRMADAGYTSPGAENIAKGYPTAAAVVKGWMNSPGHRANILNCGLRAIGVGRASGSGGPLWTQDFGWK